MMMDRCKKKKKKKKKQTRTVQKLNNKRVSRRNRTPALPYSFLLAEVARFALRNWNENRTTSRQFHQKILTKRSRNQNPAHKQTPPSILSLSRARARSLALNTFLLSRSRSTPSCSLARAQTLGPVSRSWRESGRCTTLTCGSGMNPGDFTTLTYSSSVNPVD
jgi:hypothetical protein